MALIKSESMETHYNKGRAEALTDAISAITRSEAFKLHPMEIQPAIGLLQTRV